MGLVTSFMSWENAPQQQVEYSVHGLIYWPGKMIPYKYWPSAILDKRTGNTYDEETILKGGAKSKRERLLAKRDKIMAKKEKLMARVHRLIESYSDSDLNSQASKSEDDLHSISEDSETIHDFRSFDKTDSDSKTAQTRLRERNNSTSENSFDSENVDNFMGRNTNSPRNRPNSMSPTEFSIEDKICDANMDRENCQYKKDFESLKRDIEEREEKWKSYKDYPFENLVFSGGGIKGYAYIGAIKALEDAGIMPHIKRFAGSSAGAMCIACLAVGYDAQDVSRFFYVDLKETFNDQQCACICCVPKLYTRYGIHPAKRYYKGLGDILANKCGNPDITFKQFHERFEKELCIVVCNITKMTAEYCHHTTTPDLPIRQAVRMSMAVPCIYEPPVREIDGQTNYYVDGSAGDHFPLHCFDGPTIGANNNSPPNEKTIGFFALSEKDAEHLMWQNAFGKSIPPHYRPMYLPDSKLARVQLREHIKQRKKNQRNFNEKAFMNQLEKFSHASLEHLGLRMKHYEAPNKTHFEANNIIDYMVAHIESLLISQVVSNLKPNDENRTIPINCGYIESHAYDIEPADREFMLKQGYSSARLFLQHYVNRAPRVRHESVV